MYKFNKTILLSAVMLIIAISLIGCAGAATNTATKPADNTTKPADNTTKVADNTTKPADNTTKPADTKASADKIGVPECDEYVEKYEACIFEKVPEAQRATFKSSFEAQRNGYKTAAATPQGKAALATGCKAALDAAKASMASFGCKW